LYVSTQFENCPRVLETTFIARNLTITTASGSLPFVFSQISRLSLFTAGINRVEFIGGFSVAPFSDFAITAPCVVYFWSALEITAFSRAALDRVFLQSTGFLFVESGADIHLTQSTVIGEIRFQMRPDQPLGRISVGAGSDFSPSGLYLDFAAAEWSSPLNESIPLICGQFDCGYVEARSRFAMIDTAEGFYMFRGSCRANENSSCFVLTSVFTPNTTAGFDDFTYALIGSIAAIVVIVVVLTILFAWYLHRKRRAQSEIDPPERSTPISMYGP
jgi:hypothetical protein